MERLQKAQQDLADVYEQYNTVSEKQLPPIDTSDSEILKAVLEVVQNREAIAYVQKNPKNIPTEATELKRLLADVMLLLDGVDLKAIKAKNNSAPIAN